MLVMFLPPTVPLALSPAVVNEAEGSTGLAEGLEQELQLGVKERLEGDPDFNSQQFPSADKVYQPSK